jgi:hypothetical protein
LLDFLAYRIAIINVGCPDRLLQTAEKQHANRYACHCHTDANIHYRLQYVELL